MTTPDPKKRALILGATGGFGREVGRALAAHGWHLTAMTRDPAKATSGNPATGGAIANWVQGDAMQRDDVIRAAAGVSVIVHAVNPPGYRRWGTLVLPMIDNTIAAARACGGARIVLPGNIYNFDPATTPVIDGHTPQSAVSRKGRVRIALEQRLSDAAPAVPALIVRAGDFIGPDVRSSWFTQVMVKPGKPIKRFVSLARGVPHTYAYLPDLAEAIARLLEMPERLQPYESLPFAGICDAGGHDLLDAVRRMVGRPVPERQFPWWMMRGLAVFGGFARELVEMEPYWRHPVRLDNARLLALIGEEPHTPLDEVVRRTLARA